MCGPSGQDEADKATAVAVLDAIDENFPVDKQPIEVYCEDNKLLRVTANGNVPLRTIWLPPCIPKQSKVYGLQIGTSHPHSVQIKETLRPGTTDGSGVPLRELTFSVLPEWKMPENKNGNAAVADAAVAEWKWSASVTLNPFWAVRRMTYEQLERERAKPLAAYVKFRPRFNCILKNIACSSTIIAAI